MREIKFRAWDKKNQCMKVVTELDFFFVKGQSMAWGMQGALEDVWLDGENTSYIPCDVVLMQFTGLKDCKRTEKYPSGQNVFEGDICRAKYNNGLTASAEVFR